MTLQGKGFFIWKIKDCEKGSPDAIAAAARASGLTHVLIKIADGNIAYNVDSKTHFDLAPAVVAALRVQKIQVWGWHFVYGSDPLGEAKIAIRRVQELGLDGYVIDAENEYKQPGRSTAATRFMNELRKSLPSLPMALSSYRFPTYHPQLPWQAFLEQCQYNMPQVYWEKAHNPIQQMARCLREFQALKPYRPVIPTAPAYKWDGWRPTDQDMLDFFTALHDNHVPAANFFSWDECRRDLNNLWVQVANYTYGELPPNPNQDITDQLLAAFNQRSLEKILQFYRPDAVQVTAARTIQGTAAIRAWYDHLLNDQLSGAAFMLISKTGSGASRHFTWRATRAGSSDLNSSDTLGLVEGKIAYHYSSYQA